MNLNHFEAYYKTIHHLARLKKLVGGNNWIYLELYKKLYWHNFFHLNKRKPRNRKQRKQDSKLPF